MSPKINKYAFQNMTRKHIGSSSTFDKIKKANDILELLLKTSSFLLIIGIMFGAFILFNYLNQHKMLAMFNLSIAQPKFLLFIAISSFLFALILSAIAISGPLIYYYSIMVLKTTCEIDNKERNIYFDILIFLAPLSIPLITLQHAIPNIYLLYVYIAIALTLSLIKVSINISPVGIIDKKKLRIIFSFIILFVISIIIMILPLYLIIKVIASIEIANKDQDLIQFSIMLVVITTYSVASSIVVNNKNSTLVTTLIILYVIFVSLFVFPKEISNIIIQRTKIGQLEVELALDTKLNLLKTDNEKYRKFWVLINFQDLLIVSNSKDDKIFHVISKSNIIDMKFDTENDNHGKTNK